MRTFMFALCAFLFVSLPAAVWAQDAELGQVQALLDAGKVDDAVVLMQDVEKRFAGNAQVTAMAVKVKSSSDEVFATNLAEAQKYLNEGKVATAVEFLKEIEKIAAYPDQAAKCREMLASIEASGADERSIAAQSLYNRALGEIADGKPDQAYATLQELVRTCIATEFYRVKKAEIGAKMREIKMAKLAKEGGELKYYADFDGGPDNWDAAEPTATSVLESGAIQLKFQPEDQFYSCTARVVDNNNGVVVLTAAEGWVVLRYYINVPAPIHVRLNNRTQKDNFDTYIREPVAGRWMWVSLPLPEFKDAAHEDKKFAANDLVGRIQISTGPPGVAVTCLIDEIAVVFGAVPPLYAAALKQDAAVTPDYIRDPKAGNAFFSAGVIQQALTLKRGAVKARTILVYGDKAAEGLDLAKAGFGPDKGFARTAKSFPAGKTYADLAAAFTADLNGLPAAPEAAVICVGYEELTALLKTLSSEKRAAKKAPKYGLEPQFGGQGGWWIWLDPTGKIDYGKACAAGTRAFVATDGGGPKGNPTSCNCPEYKSKQTCVHMDFIKEKVRVDKRREEYGAGIMAAYEAVVQACLARGTMPVIVAPAFVPDPAKLISEWNYDYKNKALEAAMKTQVPFLSLFNLTADPERGAKMRGGPGGVSAAGFKEANVQLGDLYGLLEKYCFRPSV
ncbi:MAG: hypothetical protein ABIF71_06180 [Planctomycetota bacterium]